MPILKIFEAEFSDKTQLWATLQNGAVCYGRMGHCGKAKELYEHLVGVEYSEVKRNARRWCDKCSDTTKYKNF